MVDEADSLPTPRNLPPFRRLHLVALTAAITLVGLAAWSLRGTLATKVLSVIIVNPTIRMLVIALSCIAEGGLLFVATMVVAWKLLDRSQRLDPGHYLAFQRAGAWIFGLFSAILTDAALGSSALAMSSGRLTSSTRWLLASITYAGLAMTICFWIWYLWLAFRSDETKSWRRVFAILAVVPATGALLSLATMVSNSGFGPPRYPSLLLLVQAISAFIQAVGLGGAMLDDSRRIAARHWSHWMAVAICFAGFIISACLSSWIAIRYLIAMNMTPNA
jgi:hypothetical protein